MWDTRGGAAQWFKGNEPGWFQYIIQPGSKCVLLGEYINKKSFSEIFELARNDPDFKPKSGFASDEKRP